MATLRRKTVLCTTQGCSDPARIPRDYPPREEHFHTVEYLEHRNIDVTPERTDPLAPGDNRHTKLKQKAVEWLQGKGLSWLTEYALKPTHISLIQTGYVVDVVGFLPHGGLIPIECGGLNGSKGRHLLHCFPISYHWPYGAEKPHALLKCPHLGRKYKKEDANGQH